MPPVLIVQYYFKKRRPFAAGISLAGHSLGTMLMIPLLRILVMTFGLRAACLLHAAIVSNIFATSLLYWPIVTMKHISRKEGKASNECKVLAPVVEDEKVSNSLHLSQDSEGVFDVKTLHSSTQSSIEKVDTEEPSTKRTCSSGFQAQFRKHVDIKLLKYLPFLLFLIATVLDEYCISVMYSMSPVKANKDAGIELLQATVLPSVIGTFSTVSRLISSFIVNLACVNRTLYLGVSMLMMGVITATSCLAWNFTTYAISMAAFGVFLGKIR